jgi:hypothetical protein
MRLEGAAARVALLLRPGGGWGLKPFESLSQRGCRRPTAVLSSRGSFRCPAPLAASPAGRTGFSEARFFPAGLLPSRATTRLECIVNHD